MNTEEIKILNDRHIINTYGTRKLALLRGKGATLWDAEGREYLDFFAGIATCGLGHCHPAVTKSIAEQAATLVHVSNLYYIEPQVKLAAKLAQHSFAPRWFFCNSGAEANEAAFKLVRRYWSQQGTPKPGIITAKQSFHGRTIAAITATGQPKYHAGFEPLAPGFSYVEYDDIAALEAAITPDTGAVCLEAIQGEGGVRVPAENYLAQVRALCDKHNILLILDEVQTGIGRTGKLFAHEHSGISPDIMTLAKALANGVPIGALGCTEKVAQGFEPGSHASTFGGNPLSTAAACATLEVVTGEGFLETVQQNSAYLFDKLNKLAEQNEKIVEVRGKGMMVGIEFKEPVTPVINAMLEVGVICGPAGPNVLRLVPPLIVTPADIDRVVGALESALEVVAC